MKQEQFTNITNDMVKDIIEFLNALVRDYGKDHGEEHAMNCFGSALAIATGNLLSQLCYGLADPKMRSGYIRNFHTLMQETEEAHSKRIKESQH